MYMGRASCFCDVLQKWGNWLQANEPLDKGAQEKSTRLRNLINTGNTSMSATATTEEHAQHEFTGG